MAQYQDHVIILKTRAYREADSLVTLFGLKAGKVGAVARGMRRPKSRLLGGLNPLSYSVVGLYRGRASLENVTEAELLEGFPRLPQDLERLAWATVLADAVDQLWQERESSPETFSTMVAALEALNEERPSVAVGLAAGWHLLRVAGYGPNWQACQGCGVIFTQGPITIDLEHSMVFCPLCQGRASSETVKVSLGSLRSLQYWLTIHPRKFGQADVKGSMKDELIHLFQRYMSRHVGRRLRSFEFLDTINRMTASERK